MSSNHHPAPFYAPRPPDVPTWRWRSGRNQALVTTALATISVSVTDAQGATATASVTAARAPVPVPAVGYVQFKLPGPATVGELVGTLPVSNLPLTSLSITGGDSGNPTLTPPGYFSVNAATQQLRVTSTPKAVMPPAGTYSLTIAAANQYGAGPVRTGGVIVIAPGSTPPPPPPAGIFSGSPNVTITSITPSITASRSGTIQTPAFIHVSASAVTAVGSTNPYEDLEYSWNFGDPSGVETFVSPYTGTTINANSAQTGPEAVYVYRNAGNYTITLTCRGKDGAGYTTAQATLNVSVSAFAPTNTWYFSQAGNDTTGNGSQGNPYKSVNKMVGLLANNTQFYFNRGDTFSDQDIDISRLQLAGVRIGAYGTGANPIIAPGSTNVSGLGALAIVTGHGSNNFAQSDIVVSNLKISNSTGFTPGILINIGGGPGTSGLSTTDVYIDNCSSVHTLNTALNNVQWEASQIPPACIMQNVGFWNCSHSQPFTAAGGMGYLGGPQQWGFVVGGSISGPGDSSRIHHLYWHVGLHGLTAYVNFGLSDATGTNPTRLYSIRLAYSNANDSPPGVDGPASQFYGQYYNVTECNLNQTIAAGIIGANNPNDPSITRCKQIVYQKLAISNIFGQGQSGVFTATCAETCTIRDTYAWNCAYGSADIWFNPNGGTGHPIFLHANIYRNQAYDTVGMQFINYVLGDGGTPLNWGSGGPFPQQFTDNIFQSSSASAIYMNIVTADFTTAGSLIDRNQNYTPSQSSFNEASNVRKTVVQWQALGWDPHGIFNTNPNWPNPGNGNFGPPY